MLAHRNQKIDQIEIDTDIGNLRICVIFRVNIKDLLLGEQIEITVKEIRRNQVRLGISAPDNMRIYRKELLVRDAARENMESDAEGGADARE